MSPDVVPIRRALLSVWDKTGLVELARALVARECELIATGGTARCLAEAGLAYREVREVTGAPEILEGRVKTLHPAIHAGILARLDQQEELARAGHRRIGLVVANLYPFEAARAEGRRGAELLEMIDIGGPAMVRAAAKNHPAVGVVVDPADYGRVTREIRESGGLSARARLELARKAFARTAAYDALVAAALAEEGEAEPRGALPARLVLALEKKSALRYGENPHQRGALYATAGPAQGTAGLVVLGGKELSYNNYLDADAALRLALDLPGTACAIVKHGNPCGVGVAPSVALAFERAHEGDPLSAFGGIVVATRPVDEPAALALTGEGQFYEVALAPAVSPEALLILQTRPKWGKSLRVLVAPEPGATSFAGPAGALELVSLEGGGILAQDPDPGARLPAALASVTSHAVPPELSDDLDLAWRVAAHVKSNAIVLVRDGRLVGMGAGQPSRVDSVEIALKKAGERARGAVLASDAFFPFADGVELAGAAGVAAIVQPGGSKRDGEVAQAAERAGMAMLITGERHFRH